MFDFTEIGLSNRDRRVYEALLEWPQTSLRHLASVTGINRGSVYESIKSLVTAGLVASTKPGHQQRYVAQDPVLLLELLAERQRQAKLAEAKATLYIRQLAKREEKELTDTLPFAMTFEGDEGVAAILRDVLKTMRDADDKQYYVVSSKRIRQYMYANFPNFTRQRIAAGIAVRVMAIGSGGEQDPLAHRRWLSLSEQGDVNCYTIIYASKTAFISMNDENILTAIVIDNPGITHVQLEQFRRAWQTLPA